LQHAELNALEAELRISLQQLRPLDSLHRHAKLLVQSAAGSDRLRFLSIEVERADGMKNRQAGALGQLRPVGQRLPGEAREQLIAAVLGPGQAGFASRGSACVAGAPGIHQQHLLALP
jgi:hypothetical protein